MALSKLSGDEQRIILGQLCNTLEPRLTMYFSSASSELRVLLTPALLQQLKADHEAAAALCRKVGMRSCKELREAKHVDWRDICLTATDLALLGTLGSVLPALETLNLQEPGGAAGPDGVQRLAAGLGAGALAALTKLDLEGIHMGDAGASALAAALGRGALPRLKIFMLSDAAIGDAELVVLAPALRRLPALEVLGLSGNPFSDEGLAALVAPPPPAGALPLPAGGLKKLKYLLLHRTQVTDAGCAALASALDSGALPALKDLRMDRIPASDAALVALAPALRRLPALEGLDLERNPFGDEGIAALVAPPPADALPPPTGVLTKLKTLRLGGTQVTDVGCAALAAALDSGALPALEQLFLFLIPASDAATDAVHAALARSRAARVPS